MRILDDNKHYSISWGEPVAEAGWLKVPNALATHFHEIKYEHNGEIIKMSLSDVGFIAVLFSFDKNKGIYPSNKNIANRAGIQIRNIQKKLSKLEKLGCLNRLNRNTDKGDATSNILDFSPLWHMLGVMIKTSPPPVKNIMTPPVKSVTTPIDEKAPQCQCSSGTNSKDEEATKKSLTKNNITKNKDSSKPICSSYKSKLQGRELQIYSSVVDNLKGTKNKCGKVFSMLKESENALVKAYEITMQYGQSKPSKKCFSYIETVYESTKKNNEPDINYDNIDQSQYIS